MLSGGDNLAAGHGQQAGRTEEVQPGGVQVPKGQSSLGGVQVP